MQESNYCTRLSFEQRSLKSDCLLIIAFSFKIVCALQFSKNLKLHKLIFTSSTFLILKGQFLHVLPPCLPWSCKS